MGITYSVIADISQNVSNGTKTYHGKNGNTIGLTRTDNPEIKTKEGRNEKLENYKQYHHKFPENNAWWSVTYELEAINHGNNKQEGLDKAGFNTYKALEVVYWLRDEHNSFPLIIGLGTSNLTFFQRKINTSNRWERADIKHPADLSEYKNVLCKLNDALKSVVIIQLRANQPYCAHPSIKQGEPLPKDCSSDSVKFSNVSVTCDNKDNKGFDKYTHAFGRGHSMKILSAVYGNNVYSFGIRDINAQYRDASVYYSSDDISRKNPLIIELVSFNGEKSEYYTLGDKLVRLNLITGSVLLDHLDELNCRKNNIVILDVFQRERYYCKCGYRRHKDIHVKQPGNDLPNGYSVYEHTLEGTGDKESQRSSFNKHRFKDGRNTRTFSTISDKFIGCHVYFCNNNTNIPLLIYVNGGSGPGKWFKKGSGRSDIWTDQELSSLKNHMPSSPSATDSITKELNKICKELKIGCPHETNVISATAAAPESPSAPNSHVNSLVSESFVNSFSESGSESRSGGSGFSGSNTIKHLSQGQSDVDNNGGDDKNGPGEDQETTTNDTDDRGGEATGVTTGSDGGVGGELMEKGREQNATGHQENFEKFIKTALVIFQRHSGIISASVTPGIATAGIGAITYSCLKRRKL